MFEMKREAIEETETTFMKNGRMLLEELIAFCNGERNLIHVFFSAEELRSKVFKPGPDRTVRPENPRTSLFSGFLSSRTVLWKKNRYPWEPWSDRMVLRTAVRPVFEVRMIFFVSAFPVNFGPHRNEVMIRSRRNEKEMKEHEEEQKSEGFRVIR